MMVSQDKLYDFASIEVATNKFIVVWEFFESLDEDHIRLHEGIAYCSDAVEYALGCGGRGTGDRTYEVDERIRTLRALVQSFETERHDVEQVCV